MGQVYTEGKNSQYWSLIERLPDSDVYNTDWNVLPYLPTKKQLFVDFFPELFVESVDTYLKIWLNGTFFKSVKIVDEIGTIYAEIILPYGYTDIMVTNSADLFLKSYQFLCINIPFYYETLGNLYRNNYIEALRSKNDLFLNEVRDDNIYNNFGSLFKLNKPVDFTYTEYRNLLIALRTAFIDQGTYKGIKSMVKAITGTDPDIIPWDTLKGWVVYNSLKWTYNPPWTDNDPGIDHYYVEGINTNTRAKPGIKMYSYVQKNNWIKIFVNSSTRNVFNELVIRAGNIDYLGNKFLTSGPITLTQGVIVYTEGALNDFLADRTNGKILWNIGMGPATGETYEADYTYTVKELIEYLGELIKPAHIKIVYKYL